MKLRVIPKRLPAVEAEALAWVAAPRNDESRSWTSRLGELGSATARWISFSTAVAIVHLATLKYIFLSI